LDKIQALFNGKEIQINYLYRINWGGNFPAALFMIKISGGEKSGIYLIMAIY